MGNCRLNKTAHRSIAVQPPCWLLMRNIAVGVFVSLGMAACGGGDDGSSSTPEAADLPAPVMSSPAAAVIDRYSLVGGCYALKSLGTNTFVDSDYVLSSQSPEDSEAFFMQATGLGSYLLYDSDKRMLTASEQGVTAQANATDGSIWTVRYDTATKSFTLDSELMAGRLSSTPDGTMALVNPSAADPDNATRFSFVKTPVACTPYPEMPLDVSGPVFEGRGVDKPVLGFADVHSHIGMSHELSADGTVGPSAGGVLYGQPFNPLGVEHALDDCEAWHGPDGIRDVNNVIIGEPTATHDTQGWPTFVDWPGIRKLTHQATYYRWLERTYRTGLRLLVTYGTNIKGLCQLGANASGHPDADCEDHSISLKQNNYIYQMQDYIDAQAGGPGKGWFRIVMSPGEAREVINDGNMAVVLGLEASQLFDCGVTMLPDGTEMRHCDKDSFDAKLQGAYDLGVRQLVPVHDINNAFGGTGLLQGKADVLNMLNFIDTKAFFETEDCPDDGVEGYYRTPGSVLTGIPANQDNLLTQAVSDQLQGPLPLYTPGVRQCNTRGLTDLGKYAFQRFMDMGMVLSLDHQTMRVKRSVLDLAEEQNPPYPIVSGHGAQGGLSNEMAKEIFALGGYIFPYKWHGASMAKDMRTLKSLYDEVAATNLYRLVPFAFGYGYDGNGFGGYNPPRSNPDQLVSYPFTLFQGDDWGPQFAAAGVQPVTVDKLSIPGGRTWDTEVDGTAHYGLIADYVEELRLEGGKDAMTALYNSAEAYLQMWENAYYREGRE